MGKEVSTFAFVYDDDFYFHDKLPIEKVVIENVDRGFSEGPAVFEGGAQMPSTLRRQKKPCVPGGSRVDERKTGYDFYVCSQTPFRVLMAMPTQRTERVQLSIRFVGAVKLCDATSWLFSRWRLVKFITVVFKKIADTTSLIAYL